ncbi:pentapeptide repeat-containing protein [uncultured Rothia sp.]|uniref:pentapeptide repeat-containing protein n=1 Tax=uncultured Rothia sp. TaxID=316088 RepID=UPI0037DCB1B7
MQGGCLCGACLCRTRCCGASFASTSFSGTRFCRCRLGITSLSGIPRRRIGFCAVLYRVFCLVLFRLIHSVNDTPHRCVCVSISLHCSLCRSLHCEHLT